MSAANAEISRDNPQMLFVTVFAAVLDLESGDLDYCTAGHEYPLLLERGAQSVRRLDGGGGPPLCTVEDFAFRGARVRLPEGALLCVVTDGVVEARNPQGVMSPDKVFWWNWAAQATVAFGLLQGGRPLSARTVRRVRRLLSALPGRRQRPVFRTEITRGARAKISVDVIQVFNHVGVATVSGHPTDRVAF